MGGDRSRLLFDNIQRMIDRDYAASVARQQQRALKTNHQGSGGRRGPARRVFSADQIAESEDALKMS